MPVNYLAFGRLLLQTATTLSISTRNKEIAMVVRSASGKGKKECLRREYSR